MRRPKLRWSPAENRALDPYVRGVVERRYTDAAAAARAYQRETRELDGDRAVGLPPPRSFFSVRGRIQVLAREQGRVSEHVSWSSVEIRVLDTYARAVLRGEFRDARQATDAYLREVDHLRRRYRRAKWPRVRRSRSAVYRALLPRLQKLGRLRMLSFWTRTEERLIDYYARRVLQGLFPDAQAAARELMREMTRRRKRRAAGDSGLEVRTSRAVYTKLRRRLRQLGRQISDVWRRDERQIVRRSARDLLERRYRSVPAAARVCERELDRLRRMQPRGERRLQRRTRAAIRHMIALEAQGMRRRWSGTVWTPQELRVVERFARAFMNGRYRQLSTAARDCVQALDRLRLRYPHASWLAARRGLPGVYAWLLRLTAKKGRVMMTGKFSPEERRVLTVYARALLAGRYRTALDAAQDLHRKFGQLRRQYPHAPWLRVHRQVNALKRAVGQRMRELRSLSR